MRGNRRGQKEKDKAETEQEESQEDTEKELKEKSKENQPGKADTERGLYQNSRKEAKASNSITDQSKPIGEQNGQCLAFLQ